jgi:hypothetical protein
VQAAGIYRQTLHQKSGPPPKCIAAMLSQPFQKLLVTEKWVWRPRGFKFLEESKLLVSTHRDFQNSRRAIQVQPSITRIWQASLSRLTRRLPSSEPVSFSLRLERVIHWERIASRGRPAFSHLVNSVSLTNAGRVKSFFEFFFCLSLNFAHTSSSTHELRLFLPLLFIYVTLTCSARLRSSTQCCPPNISSVTIDHDELFELPRRQGRRVA